MNKFKTIKNKYPVKPNAISKLNWHAFKRELLAEKKRDRIGFEVVIYS